MRGVIPGCLARATLVVCLTFGMAQSLAGASEELKGTLTPVSKGFAAQVGYYITQRMLLTHSPPSVIKQEPIYMGVPWYGLLVFGTGKSSEVWVVLDEADDGSAAKLYVDATGDSDLTHIDPILMDRKTRMEKDPETGHLVETVEFTKEVSILPRADILEPDAPHKALTPYSVVFSCVTPKTAKLRGLPTDALYFYRDYGCLGKITLGKKTYDIALLDERAIGRFDDVIHGFGDNPRVSLLIDRDGNHKFDLRFERYDLNSPFTIDNVTYRVKRVAPDGTSLVLEKAKKHVEETPILAEMSDGMIAPSFVKADMTGKTVHFPHDYRGKIVLLDFWGSFWRPCNEELPHIARALEKFQGQRFAVLGISLDRGQQTPEQVAEFLKINDLNWPEIYDGTAKGFELARLYGVDSIPRAFLIDGTTGKILATGDSLRGQALAGTVEKALNGRSAGDK